MTLAVIGVVASLTIPALIQNTTDKQCLTSLKKQYSVLSQAVMRLQSENGSIDFTDGTTIRDDFETVMPFIKKGPQNQLFPDAYRFYKNYTDEEDWSSNTYASAVLKDGSLWKFVLVSTTCSGTYPTAVTNICADVKIDVNGLKAPNMWGKDLFAFRILKQNGNYVIDPHGGEGDNRNCTPPAENQGESSGCTQEALLVSSPSDMP